jgi:hypothetical protein
MEGLQGMQGQEQRQPGERVDFPPWAHTEWTRDQRVVAIAGLFLLTSACALLLSGLVVWGLASLAVNTVLALGVILLCMGTTLISAVYCYVFIHSHNNEGYVYRQGDRGYGSRAGFIWGISAVLILELLAAVLSLAAQLVVILQILIVGWSAWQATSPLAAFGAPSFIYTMLLGVCLTFNLLIPPGFLTTSYARKWRPTRDPTAADTVISAPITGVRLALRRLVMSLPWVNLPLLLTPLYVLLSVGAQPPIPAMVAVLGALGAFFLVAALVEVTHRP